MKHISDYEKRKKGALCSLFSLLGRKCPSSVEQECSAPCRIQSSPAPSGARHSSAVGNLCKCYQKANKVCRLSELKRPPIAINVILRCFWWSISLCLLAVTWSSCYVDQDRIFGCYFSFSFCEGFNLENIFLRQNDCHPFVNGNWPWKVSLLPVSIFLSLSIQISVDVIEIWTLPSVLSTVFNP